MELYWLKALEVGLYIVYFKRYDNIMIHMKRYSIFNDTFCLVLEQNKLIYPQISLEFGNFNDQNNLNLSKNVSF